MDNYTKGEVVEVEEPPIFPLDDTGVQMKVNSGSKISNVMRYALNKMKEKSIQQVSWNGSGNAVPKTVSCAEIMKRRCMGLHQMTKVRYRRVEEYWEPQIAGLERLKVNRDIPAISILLSKVPLDKTQPGYQAPGSFDEFWKEIVTESEKRPKQKRPLGKRDPRYRGEYFGPEGNKKGARDNRQDNGKDRNNWRQKNGKVEKRKAVEGKDSDSKQTEDAAKSLKKTQKSDTAVASTSQCSKPDSTLANKGTAHISKNGKMSREDKSTEKEDQHCDNKDAEHPRESESMDVSPVGS